tara:strand:- start:147 stop:956 length:810 start_codon:yes stop_codon:yes gene_type:complete
MDYSEYLRLQSGDPVGQVEQYMKNIIPGFTTWNLDKEKIAKINKAQQLAHEKSKKGRGLTSLLDNILTLVAPTPDKWGKLLKIGRKGAQSGLLESLRQKIVKADEPLKDVASKLSGSKFSKDLEENLELFQDQQRDLRWKDATTSMKMEAAGGFKDFIEQVGGNVLQEYGIDLGDTFKESNVVSPQDIVPSSEASILDIINEIQETRGAGDLTQTLADIFDKAPGPQQGTTLGSLLEFIGPSIYRSMTDPSFELDPFTSPKITDYYSNF